MATDESRMENIDMDELESRMENIEKILMNTQESRMENIEQRLTNIEQRLTEIGPLYLKLKEADEDDDKAGGLIGRIIDLERLVENLDPSNILYTDQLENSEQYNKLVKNYDLLRDSLNTIESSMADKARMDDLSAAEKRINEMVQQNLTSLRKQNMSVMAGMAGMGGMGGMDTMGGAGARASQDLWGSDASGVEHGFSPGDYAGEYAMLDEYSDPEWTSFFSGKANEIKETLTEMDIQISDDLDIESGLRDFFRYDTIPNRTWDNRDLITKRYTEDLIARLTSGEPSGSFLQPSRGGGKRRKKYSKKKNKSKKKKGKSKRKRSKTKRR